MSDPRMPGLVLMGLASATFVATTAQVIPSIAFFPALVVFCLGALKFMKSNRVEMTKSERRVERRVNPVIRENVHAQAHAERLAAKRGSALSALSESDDEAERAARLASGGTDAAAGIEIGESDDDFVVTNDVSFPVEVQSGDALADQLKKLNALMAQGVLTEEEYAIAKAKLLG